MPGGEASPAGHSPLARCEQAPWHDGSCTGGVIALASMFGSSVQKFVNKRHKQASDSSQAASGGLCLEVGHVHVSKKLSSPPATTSGRHATATRYDEQQLTLLLGTVTFKRCSRFGCSLFGGSKLDPEA